MVYIFIGDLAMPHSSSSHSYPHVAVESATVAKSASRDMLPGIPLTAGALPVIRTIDLLRGQLRH